MNESTLLARILTEPTIRVLAGDRYYRRGVDYFQRGQVVSLEERENSIQAVVRGTEEYSVEIAATDNRLDFQCDCPLGENEEFCKHCVATALAWIHREATGVGGKAPGKTRPTTKPKGRRSIAKPQITAKEIAGVLGSTDKAKLVDLILEWSQDEPGLRAKLTHYVALAMGPEAAVRQATLSLEKAIRIRGYVSYHQAGVYAGTVHSAIDSVEKLVESGHASPVIDLCETPLRWLAAATGYIDDSEGQMAELMERLQQIHLRACEAARPDPAELAGRLFRAELLAEYGEFCNSAQKYADLLGPEGLRAFRRLAEEEWAKVPVRVSERRGSTGGGEWRGGYSITAIMMSLARQSGDVELLVSILERDLASACRYLQIAETYREAENADKALEWAERGIAAFPERTDGRLRLFLAEEYQRRERHQEAIRVAWLEFQDHASLDTYRLLERFARKDDDWDEWRERALRNIRREPASSPAARRANAMVQSSALRKRDRSLLVEIFLYERKLEDAWREAQAGGCSDVLWLRLAQASETENPDRSIPVYLRLAEAGIVDAPSHRYDHAVKLLEQAAQLHLILGRSGEFHRYLEALRERYKAKRNLQKLVEERRPSLYLE